MNRLLRLQRRACRVVLASRLPWWLHPGILLIGLLEIVLDPLGRRR